MPSLLPVHLLLYGGQISSFENPRGFMCLRDLFLLYLNNDNPASYKESQLFRHKKKFKVLKVALQTFRLASIK